MSDLVGNPEDRFSQNEAHIKIWLYIKYDTVNKNIVAKNVGKIKVMILIRLCRCKLLHVTL